MLALLDGAAHVVDGPGRVPSRLRRAALIVSSVSGLPTSAAAASGTMRTVGADGADGDAGVS